MNPQVTVEDWIKMFEKAGITQAQMKQWHRIFEAENAAGHESFLEWLGLPATRIKEIRTSSR